jgi:hypothetical protein
MVKRRENTRDLVVSKTITIPLTVMEKILDEADLMNVSFSVAVQRLVTLQIAIRKNARDREEEERIRINGPLTEEEKRILGRERAKQ